MEKVALRLPVAVLAIRIIVNTVVMVVTATYNIDVRVCVEEAVHGAGVRVRNRVLVKHPILFQVQFHLVVLER